MNPKLPRVYVLVAAGFIAAYFAYFATGSLRAEFTHDDLMNCYRAWFYPLPSLLADNLLFYRFSPMYRPFGALAYKAFFGPFGFDLLPLRVLLFLILAGDVFLVYKLCRMLTGSSEPALLAALLHAYHMKLAPLYYNTGTLYDIFAFFFYFAALGFYVFVRQAGKSLGVLPGLAVLLLYILALDSKELAASLPLTLLAYEVLWHPPALSAQDVTRWFTRQAWLVWVTGVMAAAFAAGRVLTEQGGIGNVGHYQVSISTSEYLAKVAHYLNELFYAPNWFDTQRAGIFVVALLVVSALSRSRALLFSAVLFVGGILPMAFIAPRALSAVYIPLAGLSMFAAVLLGFVCNGLRRLSRSPALQPLSFFAVFGLTALFLVRVHPGNEHVYVAASEQYREISNAREKFQQLHPTLPEGSRVLIFETPFPQYSPGYNNLFMIRLAYRDASLEIMEKARLEENNQPLIPSDYDYLVSYENGRWTNVEPDAAAIEAQSMSQPEKPE